MSNYSLGEALRFAVLGDFPEDFDQWEMEDTTVGPQREGWTITHEAARHHDLPAGLDQFLTLATKDGTTVAHVLAEYGALPDGFADWALADNAGWTVAHEAANNGVLPNGFNQWQLATPDGYTVAQSAKFGEVMDRIWANNVLDVADAEVRDPEGWTAAHFAAAEGYLPEGFDLWHLVSNSGETVAQSAAKNDRLPEDFDQWGLVPEKYRPASPINENSSGDELVAEFERVITDIAQQIMQAKNFSVKQATALAQRALSRIPDKMEEQAYNQTLERLANGDIPTPSAWEWRLADHHGCTLAHHAAMRGLLPEGFTRWDLTDGQGYTVAHYAAEHGHLPEDFRHWELATDEGWTVAHEAAEFGNLPEDFHQWDLTDNEGHTVRDIVASFEPTKASPKMGL